MKFLQPDITRPLKTSLIIFISPAIYITILGMIKPVKLCMDAGWLDVSFRECSIIEYTLTNIIYTYIYIWWLILILSLIPPISFFIKRKYLKSRR
ncbi:MAG: hypothetical protein US60_C0053G0004 [Microgenomates group bacterium GW2011_GWC1_37_8]|uniref:Uncharacterized protein n=1 Tax=Candidatus Woesebacteria bacterium GW2011_GWB1_38_8 TaxID=1618570 RepID=A0A0G0LA19_9BACT|nr:MAG: hypothetical protein US60_C0053G0004 [Microgenomates group bacterium GW2011_GWC1_37_8]KKQ84690.1 MAG: hypothetical protein UT08_C0015G0026 [Candidatus Woesebacteria bacterium GW2011_GWB1_38_8]